MFSSILILFLLPFLGRFKCKSSKFIQIMQFFFLIICYECFIIRIIRFLCSWAALRSD
jgi:hypothetical protein